MMRYLARLVLLLSLSLGISPALAQTKELLARADSLWDLGYKGQAADLYERCALEVMVGSPLLFQRLGQVYQLREQEDLALWAYYKSQLLSDDLQPSIELESEELRASLGTYGSLPEPFFWESTVVGYILMGGFGLFFLLWSWWRGAGRKWLIAAMVLCFVTYNFWTQSRASRSAVVVHEDLLMMAGPSGGSDYILSIPKGSVVELRAVTASWQKVEVEGFEGYVRPEYLRRL